MQDAILLAFRKRCKKRGYTDIHIRKSKDKSEHYIVTAIEPLSKTVVTYEDHVINFHYRMR